jgi:chemotaxis methyl-accepting protein methylase
MTIPTHSEFFREPNVAVFSDGPAAALASAALDGVLLVLQVGCSKGQETWTLAAALAAAGVPCLIDAYDTNTTALRATDQPYPVSRPDSLARMAASNGFPPACLEYFDILDYDPIGAAGLAYQAAVLPAASLRRQVSFNHGDIRNAKLEPGQYGAVAINNVLYHHAMPERDEVTVAALAPVAPNGAVLLEAPTGIDTPEYTSWRHNLPSRFGLATITSARQAKVGIYHKLAKLTCR